MALVGLVGCTDGARSVAPAPTAPVAGRRTMFVGHEAESVFVAAAVRARDYQALDALSRLRQGITIGDNAGGIATFANTLQYDAPAVILGLGTVLSAEAYQATGFASVTFFGNQGGSDLHMHLFDGSQLTEFADPEWSGARTWGSPAPCVPTPSCDDVRRTEQTFQYFHNRECDYRVNADQAVEAYWTVPTTGVNWGHVYGGRHIPDKFAPGCGSGGGGSSGGSGLNCHQEYIYIDKWTAQTGWVTIWQGYATVCE